MGPDDRRGQSLHGRDQLIRFVWNECLPCDRRLAREQPLTVVLGPRGSGKSAILDRLAAKCRAQSAQPFVPVLDLERRGAGQRCSWVIAELAYGLSGDRWPQFGRLNFPIFTLGHMIVEGIVTTTDSQQAETDIAGLLARARDLDKAAAVVDDTIKLISHLPELTGLSGWIGLVRTVATAVIRSDRMVKFLVRKGIRFYRKALHMPPNSGFSTLVELARLGKESGQESRNLVDRVLCEAFLADLADNYRGGFRPRSCLALVDNVHTETGHAFLAAMARAKADPTYARAPLTMVATSRRIDPFTQLLATGGAHEDYASLWAHFQRDTAAGLDDWQAGRSTRSQPWVYSIRLSDLGKESVQKLENELYPDSSSPRLAPFVWSLTHGHPWAVHKVLEALGELGARHRALGSTELSAVLETTCPGDTAVLGDLAADYLLLDDLHRRRRAEAVVWSAARDPVTAERCVPDTAGLLTEVAPQCWLSRPAKTQGMVTPAPVLHPWVRRIMLRKLANSTVRSSSWPTVFEKLLAGCDGTAAIRGYYEIATGQLGDAITDLNARFDDLDASTWIAQFEAVTAAPHAVVGKEPALSLHGRIKDELLAAPPADHPRRDPHDDRWITVVDMTVARWIWSDPLCDPVAEMNLIIANGYRDLARRSPGGQLRLIAEAEFYEGGGRP